MHEAIICAIHALCANDKAEIQLGATHPHYKGQRVFLPAPPRQKAHYARWRGQADSLALQLAHHEETLHARLAPQGEKQKALFTLAEQKRCEALGAEDYTGCAQNLTALYQQQQAPPQTHALSLELLTRLSPIAIKTTHKETQQHRQHLSQKLGKALSALKPHLHNQQAFAKAFQKLLPQLITTMENKTDKETPQDQPPQKKQEETQNQTPQNQAPTTPKELTLTEEEAETETDPQELPPLPLTPPQQTHPHEYKVFTRQFDRILHAEDICTRTELQTYRQELDRQMAGLEYIPQRLARLLQYKLLARQKQHWRHDAEEGILDSTRLTRILTRPENPQCHKEPQEKNWRDSVVSLLIDNSGSMRGRPIMTAAICTDILARALELCRVRTEILGFTTLEWRGGKARKKWLSEGKPKNPGRLNGLAHIIYKSAHTPWHKARRDIALMLHEGLLKENIDGEALLWAHERLKNMDMERRILMVLSDGVPIDDATCRENGASYLEDNLRQTVTFLESRIELIAIGIGNVNIDQYTHRANITDIDRLGETMIEELTRLF